MYSAYKLNKQSDRGKVKTSNLTPGFEFLIDTIKQKLFIQAATRFAYSSVIIKEYGETGNFSISFNILFQPGIVLYD